MTRFGLWLVLAGLIAVTVGCSTPTAAQGDLATRKIRVVTTIGMINDAVKNIGGERVEAIGLMGAGVDPHLYKPSADDVRKLEQADIIFYNGLELEGRMTDVFVKMARNGKPTVAVASDIDTQTLREPPEFEGKYDPHIWFDVTLWRQAVQTLNRELQKLDPASKDLYQKNTDAYLKRLDELHAYIQAQAETIPQPSRVLITAHDAFGYFGQRYGFEVRGLQGTSTATEAGAADVQGLAQFIAERKIKAIFVESSVPEATIKAVQAATRSRGWDVKIGGSLFSDAMGDEGTEQGAYIGMVKHNIDTIVSALR